MPRGMMVPGKTTVPRIGRIGSDSGMTIRPSAVVSPLTIGSLADVDAAGSCVEEAGSDKVAEEERLEIGDFLFGSATGKPWEEEWSRIIQSGRCVGSTDRSAVLYFARKLFLE